MNIIMRVLALSLLLPASVALADPITVEVFEKSTGQVTARLFDPSSGTLTSVAHGNGRELPQVARYSVIDEKLVSAGHIISPADTLLFQCEVNGVDIAVVRVEHNSFSNPLRLLVAFAGHPIQVSTIYVEAIRGGKVVSKKEIIHKPASYEWSARVLQ